MFHRLQIEEWHSLFNHIGMALFVGAFTLVLIRVFLMPRRDVERAAALPLEEDQIKESHAIGDQ